MKINWNWNLTSIVIGLLAIMVLTGSFLAWHYHDLLQAQKQKIDLTAASKDNFKDTLIRQFIDTSGHHHLEVPASQHVFNQTTIDKNTAISLGGADTAALALNIQRNQIKFWQQIAERGEGEHLKAVKLIDSLKQKVLFYQDKYIQITYHPGKDSADNGSFDYINNEQLTILQYSKRSWWLGPKHSFIDVSSNNPNTNIQGFKTLTIIPDEPKFNLKGQLKTEYDFATGIIYPSAGIMTSIGNIDIAGMYYYNPPMHRFTPTLSTTYNFFRLK